ncbi:MAG TPA: AMP-binding protein [Chloroflexota bacterium]|nr:AMP-binding protein [Chloroflexota bacterium]
MLIAEKMTLKTLERLVNPTSSANSPEHLYELLARRAQAWPDATAVGAQRGLGWYTLTSQEMLGRVDQLARELEQRGIRAGDRVVLWVPNTWLTPVYLFALWKLGAIAVPFDREMNPSAGKQIVGLVEPRLVLGGYHEKPAWLGKAELSEWWEPETSASGTVADLHWTGPSEELAAISFTSGTTGNPKGCMISHANLCSQVAVLQQNIPLDPSCRLASILPLSHLFELTCGLLYPLSAGAAIHYVPSRRGRDILRVLSEQRVTHMIAVPQLLTIMGETIEGQLRAKLPEPLLRAMFKLADRLPMTARRRLFTPVHRKLGGELRLIAAGGAALPVDVERLWERLGVRIVLGYGTSECSPVVACGAPDGSTPLGSVGKALNGVEVRLSPEGELRVKGPNVMRGYFKDPARRREVLHDGWYSTGDLAQIDREGNITLTGRAKDLIVLPSGLNVWPSDVEDALRKDPSVQDAAVIPVPTASGGIALHAYLIRRGAGTESAKEVAARCNRALALPQRISTASWWTEGDFPRTSTLKVRRHLLPLPSVGPEAKVSEQVAPPINSAVAEAVAAAAHLQAVRADQTLAELGLDSLGMVELALAIEEKTGVTVDEGSLSAEMTVAQLCQLIEAPGSSTTAQRAPMTVPVWPYTWGRWLRCLSWPIDLLYRRVVTETVVVGAENLEALPEPVMFAGTHHGFGDMPLIQHALAKTPARHFARSLVIAMAGDMLANAGWLGKYGIAAFGLFPLARSGNREENLRLLLRIARHGNAVVIFPQGKHVNPEDEKLELQTASFRLGTAVLAEALSATVVPFGVAGTERVIPPRHEQWHGRMIAGIPVSLSPTPLAIAFGQPLQQAEGENGEQFTRRLQATCFSLARQAEAALQARR